MPGNVTIGTRRPSGLVSTPWPCGLPGCIATRTKLSTSASAEFLTTSWVPTETPPVVITTSAVRTASAIAWSSSAGVSEQRLTLTGLAPASWARPKSMIELESWICPRSSGCPGATSSEPVAMIATRGLPMTHKVPCPVAAAAATEVASSRTPAASTRSPSARSSPASRMFACSPTAALTRISSGSGAAPGCWSVCSTGTTAFAPPGTAAPVITRTACPLPTHSSLTAPAGTSPMTCSVTGLSGLADATSSACTAKPSIAELVNGGTATCAVTGAVVVSPRHWANGNCADGNAATSCRIRSRYCSTLMGVLIG